FYIFIQFPLSKKAQGFALANSNAFLKDSLLILIAFFLFFQGSFEAIINNWTTTYLKTQLAVAENNTLYALSLYVLGMTMMRFLTGSIFRSVSEKKIMLGSFVIIFVGIIFLKYAQSFYFAVAGLILLGGGLAAGFPVMLGITGSCYAERSGTAFSFVLVGSLIGNMLVNYLMGLIAKRFGIYHLTTVVFIELIVMVILSGFIFSALNKRSS